MAGIFDKMRDMLFNDYDDPDDELEDDEYGEEPEQEERTSRRLPFRSRREEPQETHSASPRQRDAISFDSLRDRSGETDYDLPARTSSGRRNSAQVVSIHANVQMNVVILKPEVLEDAQEICNNLKEKRPVVVNLEKAEYPTAQRIMDFLSGACYALDGNIQRVANNIFIIAPENVLISGDMREELKTKGVLLPWAASAE